MPILPKFIVTKFTIESEVVGICNTKEEAESVKSMVKAREPNGAIYQVFEATSEGVTDAT